MVDFERPGGGELVEALEERSVEIAIQSTLHPLSSELQAIVGIERSLARDRAHPITKHLRVNGVGVWLVIIGKGEFLGDAGIFGVIASCSGSTGSRRIPLFASSISSSRGSTTLGSADFVRHP